MRCNVMSFETFLFIEIYSDIIILHFWLMFVKLWLVSSYSHTVLSLIPMLYSVPFPYCTQSHSHAVLSPIPILYSVSFPYCTQSHSHTVLISISDCYGDTVLQSKQLRQELISLQKVLYTEVKFQSKAFELMGIIDTVYTAATVSWNKTKQLNNNDTLIQTSTVT